MRADSTLQQIDWTSLREQLLTGHQQQPLPAGWKLPILPRPVTEFLQQANRPNQDLRVLSRILEQDPNLTLELLKHVNSAAMGLRFKAKTVHQAIVNLGVRKSKMVLLTAAVQTSLNKYNSKLFDLHQFWTESLEKAVFAREIAQAMETDADVAFTGAMLQDFLLPVLAKINLESYLEFWDDRKGSPCDLTEFERTKFGVHHAQAAAACLIQWNVPDELVCSVLCHHLPAEQLSEMGLLNTPVHAICLSSLIPVTKSQYQNSAAKLTEWMPTVEHCDLFDVAERVDQHFQAAEAACSHRIPLVERLEQTLARQLENSLTKEALVGRQFGNFILEGCAGEGAMGTVFRARHTMLNRPAAVKVLNKQELSELDISRFEREVQLSSSLNHPNTISIYDFGRTPDGLFYYAMEYVEGLTLKQLVQLHGPLPESRVIYLLKQICSSLQNAHEHGLIHRDIKPENIILSRRGSQGDIVTVLDFGLVMDLKDQDSVRENSLSGTPLYMAPESINQPGFSSPACDLYAIGAVGYYLLSGYTMYTGNDALDICLKQISEVPLPPSQRLKKRVAEDLEKIIMNCLQKSPEKRPASAAMLEMALSQCHDAQGWSAQQGFEWWQEHVKTNRTTQQALEEIANDATVITSNGSTIL